MSRILVVTPVPFLPADAGNRARIKTMLQALESAGHTVVVLHALRERGDVAAMQEKYGDAYIPVEYSEPAKPPGRQRLRRWQQRLGMSGGYTYGLDSWYDPTLDTSIRSAIDEWQIDVLLVEYLFFSAALNAAPANVLKILDTHDRFGDRHQRFLDAGLTPAWYSCSNSAEREGLARADVVLAIQETEANHFRSIGIDKVETVGHLVDLVASPPTATDKQVLLLGSANTINVESTQWFINSVVPLLRQSAPGAKILIAGSVCEKLQYGPAGSNDVTLLGRVDDLAGLYATAQVVVNPMLTGTGLKIKSIEALGAGKALVSTAAGCEGLEAATGTALVQADGADPMAKAIAALLADPARCSVLGAAALEFARNYNQSCLTNFNAAIATHHG